MQSPGPVVFKFGGSSVADADRLRHVAGLVARHLEDTGSPPVVVVSALGDATDHLEELRAARPSAREALLSALLDDHARVLDELAGPGGRAAADRIAGAHERLRGLPATLDPAHTLLADEAAAVDRLLSLGEDLSVEALRRALQARGVPAQVVDARTVVRTDDRFGFGRPDEPAIRGAVDARLRPLLAAGTVPVVQGFVGATTDGRTTTLGRGGSDLTASLLGAALGASEVHIWTDVEGVLSADPRIVAHPRTLDVVGFEEAVELAYFGARVLHPGAAKHAVAREVPIRVRSTFRPDHPGTLVLADRWGGPEIAAVATRPKVALIRVRGRPTALPYGFLARVFEILARHRLPVDLVATSHTSTAFTVDESEDLEDVARELEEVAEVSVRTGLSTVTVVGNGLLTQPGFDARVFGTVALTPIHLVSQASDVSLSFVVDTAEAPGVVARLHAELVEGDDEDPPRGGRETTLDVVPDGAGEESR